MVTIVAPKRGVIGVIRGDCRGRPEAISKSLANAFQKAFRRPASPEVTPPAGRARPGAVRAGGACRPRRRSRLSTTRRKKAIGSSVQGPLVSLTHCACCAGAGRERGDCRVERRLHVQSGPAQRRQQELGQRSRFGGQIGPPEHEGARQILDRGQEASAVRAGPPTVAHALGVGADLGAPPSSGRASRRCTRAPRPGWLAFRRDRVAM